MRLQPCAHVLHLDCTIDSVLAHTHCPLCRHRLRGFQLAIHEGSPFVKQDRLLISWHVLVRFNQLRMEAAASQPPASQPPASQPPNSQTSGSQPSIPPTN